MLRPNNCNGRQRACRRADLRRKTPFSVWDTARKEGRRHTVRDSLSPLAGNERCPASVRMPRRGACSCGRRPLARTPRFPVRTPPERLLPPDCPVCRGGVYRSPPPPCGNILRIARDESRRRMPIRRPVRGSPPFARGNSARSRSAPAQSPRYASHKPR